MTSPELRRRLRRRTGRGPASRSAHGGSGRTTRVQYHIVGQSDIPVVAIPRRNLGDEYVRTCPGRVAKSEPRGARTPRRAVAPRPPPVALDNPTPSQGWPGVEAGRDARELATMIGSDLYLPRTAPDCRHRPVVLGDVPGGHATVAVCPSVAVTDDQQTVCRTFESCRGTTVSCVNTGQRFEWIFRDHVTGADWCGTATAYPTSGHRRLPPGSDVTSPAPGRPAHGSMSRFIDPAGRVSEAAAGGGAAAIDCAR